MKIVCFSVFSICLLLGSSAYTTRDMDCMDLFSHAFGKLKDINPENAKGLLLKYRVTIETSDGTKYYDSVDLSIYEKKSRIVSSEFVIFQDDKAMVLIRPKSNTIFLSRPVDSSVRKIQFQNIIRMQDSIFAKMILKSCVTETGTNSKKMTFQFPVKMQDNIGMSSVQYWIDEQAVSVQKLQLNYQPGKRQQLKVLIMEFVKLNTHYASAPFVGTATANVFNSKNALKSEYKNYTIVDKRKDNR